LISNYKLRFPLTWIPASDYVCLRRLWDISYQWLR